MSDSEPERSEWSRGIEWWVGWGSPMFQSG